jgi:hypothetical protein
MKAKPAASITRFPARQPLNRLLRDYWQVAESLAGRSYDVASLEAAANAKLARGKAA